MLNNMETNDYAVYKSTLAQIWNRWSEYDEFKESWKEYMVHPKDDSNRRTRLETAFSNLFNKLQTQISFSDEVFTIRESPDNIRLGVSVLATLAQARSKEIWVKKVTDTANPDLNTYASGQDDMLTFPDHPYLKDSNPMFDVSDVLWLQHSRFESVRNMVTQHNDQMGSQVYIGRINVLDSVHNKMKSYVRRKWYNTLFSRTVPKEFTTDDVKIVCLDSNDKRVKTDILLVEEIPLTDDIEHQITYNLRLPYVTFKSKQYEYKLVLSENETKPLTAFINAAITELNEDSENEDKQQELNRCIGMYNRWVNTQNAHRTGGCAIGDLVVFADHTVFAKYDAIFKRDNKLPKVSLQNLDKTFEELVENATIAELRIQKGAEKEVKEKGDPTFARKQRDFDMNQMNVERAMSSISDA